MSLSRNADANIFLANHDVAVLSTVTKSGQVQGAAVYYVPGDDGNIYVLTKSDTSKAHNMLAHPQVAITIYDATELKTIQMQGKAHIEADLKMKRLVFDKMVRPRNYQGEEIMPPVTDLSFGGYITFRIEPDRISYTNYKDDAALLSSRGQHH
jgi:general stress protein 26